MHRAICLQVHRLQSGHLDPQGTALMYMHLQERQSMTRFPADQVML